MPLRLLPHLDAIRATPRDQRGFAAFERRPDMIAAGAGKAMIDAFDFDDEPALDAVIGDLRLAADRQMRARRQPPSAPLDRRRLEAMHVDANPAGLRFSEDMVAGAESRFDNLAPRFLDGNVDHFTSDAGNTQTPSAVRPEVEQAIYRLSETARGRQMLNHAIGNDLRQIMIYRPTDEVLEDVDDIDSAISYDPAMLKNYGAKRPIEGDGHETADFNTIMAHAFGHTEIGRRAFGLPEIKRSDAGAGPTVIERRDDEPPPAWRVEEELRATRDFENAYRRSNGKPPRTGYFQKGDVYPNGLVK
jgi:hypothetical protein